jgi:hypothetical protein
MPDRSNVKGHMVPHVAGGGGGLLLSVWLITSPYTAICINKHNDCSHMENFRRAKKRVIGTMLGLAAWNVVSLFLT